MSSLLFLNGDGGLAGSLVSWDYSFSTYTVGFTVGNRWRKLAAYSYRGKAFRGSQSSGQQEQMYSHVNRILHLTFIFTSRASNLRLHFIHQCKRIYFIYISFHTLLFIPTSLPLSSPPPSPYPLPIRTDPTPQSQTPSKISKSSRMPSGSGSQPQVKTKNPSS